MMDRLIWLHGLCSPSGVLQGGLVAGLFMAGVVGSVVHCGPMCGVFVLGQMSERMARLPPERFCEWRRASNGLLLPYHLGRLTTYAGLGALAAWSAGAFGRVAWFADLSAALLVVAALLFLAPAVRRVLPFVGGLENAPRFWGRRIGAVTRRINRGTVAGEYMLGVALGFLPCGFLYAAIAAAGASLHAGMGAAAMVVFGLGTTPSLMVVGIVGHAAVRRWNAGLTYVGPVLMALNAVLLLALAWQRVT